MRAAHPSSLTALSRSVKPHKALGALPRLDFALNVLFTLLFV
jgi:hypothetical protein